jgi:hypothetical protein
MMTMLMLMLRLMLRLRLALVLVLMQARDGKDIEQPKTICACRVVLGLVLLLFSGLYDTSASTSRRSRHGR